MTNDKKERGSSSVLVIFMMIILVTFGAFSISSANANLRLSKKAIIWVEEFYALDSVGERYLADVDYMLARGEKAASDYMANKSYSYENPLFLPEAVQKYINDEYASLTEMTTQMAERFFSIVYMNYMVEALLSFESKYGLPKLNIVYSDDATGNIIIERIECEIELTSRLNPSYHLVVGIEIKPRKSLDMGKVSRCEVTDWRQWQEQVDEAGGIEIWDGTIDN